MLKIVIFALEVQLIAIEESRDHEKAIDPIAISTLPFFPEIVH
jgi:hypothetical protein